MTRPTIAAVLLIVIWSGAAGRSSGTAPAPAIERVVVVDERGTLVTGLGAGQFRVWSDRVEVPIESVTPDASPVTAIILLDATVSSMATSGAAISVVPLTTDSGKIAGSLRDGLVSALRPGDRVRVGSIAGSVELQPSFSASRADILQAVSRAFKRPDEDLFGRSPVWDAVWTAAEAVSAEPGRRAIVLVSDGRATGNLHSRIEAGQRAVRADAAVSVIGEGLPLALPQLGETAVLVRPNVALEELAADTGGVYFADAVDQTARLFARIAAEMQASYLVRFSGPGDGRYHTLQIRVTADRTEVRARRLYFSPLPGGTRD
jgi:VWFA-related protein